MAEKNWYNLCNLTSSRTRNIRVCIGLWNACEVIWPHEHSQRRCKGPNLNRISTCILQCPYLLIYLYFGIWTSFSLLSGTIADGIEVILEEYLLPKPTVAVHTFANASKNEENWNEGLFIWCKLTLRVTTHQVKSCEVSGRLLSSPLCNPYTTLTIKHNVVLC